MGIAHSKHAFKPNPVDKDIPEVQAPGEEVPKTEECAQVQENGKTELTTEESTVKVIITKPENGDIPEQTETESETPKENGNGIHVAETNGDVTEVKESGESCPEKPKKAKKVKSWLKKKISLKRTKLPSTPDEGPSQPNAETGEEVSESRVYTNGGHENGENGHDPSLDIIETEHDHLVSKDNTTTVVKETSSSTDIKIIMVSESSSSHHDNCQNETHEIKESVQICESHIVVVDKADKSNKTNGDYKFEEGDVQVDHEPIEIVSSHEETPIVAEGNIETDPIDDDICAHVEEESKLTERLSEIVQTEHNSQQESCKLEEKESHDDEEESNIGHESRETPCDILVDDSQKECTIVTEGNLESHEGDCFEAEKSNLTENLSGIVETEHSAQEESCKLEQKESHDEDKESNIQHQSHETPCDILVDDSIQKECTIVTEGNMGSECFEEEESKMKENLSETVDSGTIIQEENCKIAVENSHDNGYYKEEDRAIVLDSSNQEVANLVMEDNVQSDKYDGECSATDGKISTVEENMCEISNTETTTVEEKNEDKELLSTPQCNKIADSLVSSGVDIESDKTESDSMPSEADKKTEQAGDEKATDEQPVVKTEEQTTESGAPVAEEKIEEVVEQPAESSVADAPVEEKVKQVEEKQSAEVPTNDVKPQETAEATPEVESIPTQQTETPQTEEKPMAEETVAAVTEEVAAPTTEEASPTTEEATPVTEEAAAPATEES